MPLKIHIFLTLPLVIGSQRVTWTAYAILAMFLNDAIFLTMQCLPIPNNAMFRQRFTKTLPYNVFDDVLKKPKHRAYDAY